LLKKQHSFSIIFIYKALYHSPANATAAAAARIRRIILKGTFKFFTIQPSLQQGPNPPFFLNIHKSLQSTDAAAASESFLLSLTLIYSLNPSSTCWLCFNGWEGKQLPICISASTKKA